MAGGDGGADKVLVAFRDVEDCAAAGNVEPFVGVGGEEVGVEFGEVEGDVAGAVGAVDAGEDLVLFAELGKMLEGHADAWQGNYCVEHGDFGGFAFRFEVLHARLEIVAEIIIGDWVGEVDLLYFRRRCFGNVCDGLLTRAVDRGENDDHVPGLEDKVSHHRVESYRGIADEDAGLHWGLEIFCDCRSRLVQ